MSWQYMSNVSFMPRPVGNADGFTSALLHSFPTDADAPTFLPPHIVHISTHSDGKVLLLAGRYVDVGTLRKRFGFQLSWF